jgi:hypothetical protein
VQTSQKEAKGRFLEALNSFVFFHLGSDAETILDDGDGSLTIGLSHRRIQSFRFTISVEEITELLEDPIKLEDFLLDHLIAHRRS